MIVNPERLYVNASPGSMDHYKLTLLQFYILDPLAHWFDITVTSALRLNKDQANLRYADGTPVPAAQKAKGVSQHTLAEAFDFTCPTMPQAFDFLVKKVPTWQLIFYIADGQAKSIHVSMPSWRTSIQKKTLLNVDGNWQNYTGTVPIAVGS